MGPLVMGPLLMGPLVVGRPDWWGHYVMASRRLLLVGRSVAARACPAALLAWWAKETDITRRLQSRPMTSARARNAAAKAMPPLREPMPAIEVGWRVPSG